MLRNGDSAGQTVAGGDTQPVTVHGVNLSITFAHNPSTSYTQQGYTEFIELRFATPVYPRQVVIGENRGMCSVVGIKARLSTEPAAQYTALWTPTEANLGTRRRNMRECETFYRVRRQYRTFAPTICMQPRLIDTLRIEMDTRTVDDWNEIDFVRLVGTTSLPPGVLPLGSAGVIFEPSEHPERANNPYDDFTFVDHMLVSASECPFQVSVLNAIRIPACRLPTHAATTPADGRVASCQPHCDTRSRHTATIVFACATIVSPKNTTILLEGRAGLLRCHHHGGCDRCVRDRAPRPDPLQLPLVPTKEGARRTSIESHARSCTSSERRSRDCRTP
jgi:hypothetical protein